MKKLLAYFNYWLPPLILMGLIFWLSSRPSFSISPKGWLNFIFFKTMHFLEYAFLALLLYRAFKNTVKKGSSSFWAGLVALLWAAGDEIHQLFVPTRGAALRDVSIDLLGIIFFFIFLWILLPKAPGKLKTWARKLALV